ncbi:MAG: hypothetical protein HUJ61_01135, partial [Bacilli bacterium]|nr:hypothetical protein [Bacilli bacterium]
IHMVDGTFSEKEIIEERKRTKEKEKKYKLKYHSLFNMVVKKIGSTPKRTSILLSIFSASILLSSLSMSVISSLKTDIQDSLDVFADDKTMVISPKQEESTIYSCTDIGYLLGEQNEENGKITRVGTSYAFKEGKDIVNLANYFALGSDYGIDDRFSLHMLNDFSLLTDEEIFPSNAKISTNQDVFLCLSHEDLYLITKFFNGEKLSIEEFGKVISRKMFNLFYFVKRNDDVERIGMKIRGVALGEETYIIHTNPYWNQYVFEEVVQYEWPNYIDLSKDESMYKCHFIETDNPYDLKMNKNHLLETAKHHFNRSFKNRYLVFDDNHRLENEVQSILGDNINYLIGNEGSYYIEPSTGTSGFYGKTFLSNDEEILDDIIDSKVLESTLIPSEDERYVFGNVLNVASKSNLYFKPQNKLISHDEIIISSACAEKLKAKKYLYLMYYIDGEIYKKRLLIKEIEPSKDFYISQRPRWLQEFFRDYFGISVFRLNSKVITISEQKDIDEVKYEELNNKVVVAMPGLALRKTIDNSTNKVKIFLEIFLLMLFFISLMIVVSIDASLKVDNAKENDILYSLGFSQNDIFNKNMIHSFLLVSGSFVISLV